MSASVTLRAGPHTLAIEYRNPQGAERRLLVGTLRQGRLVALSGDELATGSSGTTSRTLDRMAERCGMLLDGVYLLIFGWFAYALVGRAVGRERFSEAIGVEKLVVAGVATAGMAASIIYWSGLRNVMVTLSGGNDWLAYEGYARDILINGPLLRVQNGVFYYQVLYPYYLALVHWLLGEDLFGVFAVQSFGLCVTGIALYFVAKRLWAGSAGAMTLAIWICLLFVDREYFETSRILLSENLAFVTFPIAGLLTVIFLQKPSALTGLAAGIAFGLAVLTRSYLILGFPLMIVLGYMALRGANANAREAAASLGAVVLGVASVLGLVAARNYIVAGVPSIIPASGPANLVFGNRPSVPLDLSTVSNNPIYNALHLSSEMREVLEYARQQPRAFTAQLWSKLRYTLGWYRALDASLGIAWSRLALWAATIAYIVQLAASRLAAVITLGKGSIFRALESNILASLAVLNLAVVQVMTLTLLSPAPGYGTRVVRPIYVLLVPFGGWAMAAVFDRAKAHWSKYGRLGRSTAFEDSCADANGRAL